MDHFVTTTSDSDIPNAFNLGSLTSGLLKHTVTSGNSVPATATAGTDYLTTLATNADAPDSTTNIAVTSGSPANLVSKALTISAGDRIKVRVHGTVVNNSGVTRLYSVVGSLGALNITLTDGSPVGASATNRSLRYIEAIFGVHSTSAAWVNLRDTVYGAAALGTGATTTANLLGGSQQSSSNITGIQTLNIAMYSNVATPTQSFELTSWELTQIPTNP